MLKNKIIYTISLCLCLIAGAAAQDKLQLPGIFSNHAVLQKSKKVPVFGHAAPGAAVSVSIAGKSAKTTADAKGKWRVDLDLSQCAPGPHELKINKRIIKDVLIGEVWLASGQSNMAFTMAGTEGTKQELNRCDNNYIRQFCAPLTSQTKPISSARGMWIIAQRNTLPRFSAIGYYFAKKLNAELKQPVGIISCSWGGSPIEAWMPPYAIAVEPNVAKRDAATQKLFDEYPAKLKKFIADREKWIKNTGRDYPFTVLPGKNVKWQSSAKSQYIVSGVLWLRNFVTLSAAQTKVPMTMFLPRQYRPLMVFFNGQKIYEMNIEGKQYPRTTIPVNLLKAGKNEILIRYYNPTGSDIRIPQPLKFGATAFNDAKWDFWHEKGFAPIAKNNQPPKPAGAEPRTYFNSSRLFNGCINPFLPYAFRGVIWYQGETNASRHAEYGALKKSLISSWRKEFENPDMPFYYCQLAAYTAKHNNPAISGWADIRRAQDAALELPNTGVAVLTDVGEASDIHPIDKKTPGERLAAIALAKQYGKKVPFAGPSAVAAKRNAGKAVISFRDLNGGLIARPVPKYHHLKKSSGRKAELIRNSPATQLEGFAVAGADGKWFWADEAVITGSTVTVSSKRVAVPVKVRFAWSSNPSCNLFNKAGFPAVPFEIAVK